MTRLIMLSASKRRANNPEPIPAIERYQGVFFRVLKKYQKEGRLKDTDVIIVSERFGILKADDMVPYHEPFEGNIGKEEIEKVKRANLAKLSRILREKRYSQIFVVCGQEFQKLVEGFQNLTKSKIIFCKGAGLGPKAQNLRQWILYKN